MRLLSFLIGAVLLVLPVQAQEAPFKKGETIKYSVKKMAFKAGDATLTYQGQQNVDGREVCLIVFKADGFNFYDEEKIYMDAKTYAPIVVERDLNIFGKKEKITEEYQEDKIKITKTVKGKTTTETINKKGQLDNIYGAIYRYRQTGAFKVGDEMKLHLPTMDVTLKLTKQVKIDAGGKKYDAYYMESVPSKFTVWFDTSSKRIPLRINGAVGMANTVMTMTDYKE
jgi:hypothetical protein